MTKDKMNVLLRDWIATQQSRLADMAKYNVRVRFQNDNFYATLKITKTDIVIKPLDARKDILQLDESRLEKYDEFGTKGIVLYRNYSNLKWKVYFQKTKIRDAAIERLRTLTGDDSTNSDTSGSGSTAVSSASQSQDTTSNQTTGAVIIKKKLDNSESSDAGREISLMVTASSGREGSLTNMTVVEITLDPLADPGTNLAINKENNATVAAANGGIADWALGLLIALILLLITFGAVFVFLHMRNKRNKKLNKPNLSTETVSTSNNYVDPSAFDTIPIRGGGVTSSGNQFAPPKYDEIPPYGPGHAASSNSGAATTSELSGSEQSGSSGRGSAEDGEDGEDEEIRMINEGPLQREGLHRQNDDDDNLSDVSVRNTQEYLARLGIVNNSNVAQPTARLCADPRAGSSKETIHHHQSVPLDNLFDEEGNNENDMTLIYAKLNDVAGSDRASSTDEGGGVNASTLEHVMAIGGYGEVPAVTHQPSMNGSLSSIVHSEEELAGSYNWDYLLIR